MWASLAPGSAVPRARGPSERILLTEIRARVFLFARRPRRTTRPSRSPLGIPPNRRRARTFFEGWYFRVTLPESRDNLSLIYHVYDPDLPDSPRRAAGAQVCAPGGGYLFRESKDVDAFRADPHALELRMPLEPGVGVPTPDPARPAEPHHLEPEFYEVSEEARATAVASLATRPATIPRCGPVQTRLRRRVGLSRATGRRVRRRPRETPNLHRGLALRAPRVRTPLPGAPRARPGDRMGRDGRRSRGIPRLARVAEKNWGGAGFPEKWFWLQCNAFPTRPGLSVTATGANRGVVLLPGAREEVAAVMIHDADGNFYPFVPAGSDPAEVRWEVAPWGSWRVTAETSTHEVEITATIEPKDVVPGGTTVLRAPVDDPKRGMAPSCRESFRGTMRTSLWEREGRGWGSGARGRCILDAVASDVAAVEVGGGPWEEDWVGNAEMREPLGTLARHRRRRPSRRRFFKPLGDVVPGL